MRGQQHGTDLALSSAQRSGPAKDTRQSGFSLIEVLISFAILSLAIATLLPVLSNGMLAANTANSRTIARLHLESLLAEVGPAVPLKPGELTGRFEDGYSWQLTIEPHAASGSADARPVRTYAVTATVYWGSNEQRSLSLKTLRLGRGESQ